MCNRAILVCCLVFAVGSAQGDEQASSSAGSAARPAAIAAAEPKHTFDIWELQVEGNSLLDRVLIERTVYPFVGPDKTINDVEAARLALETFYRDSGYATAVVDIPEQQVSEGIVRLKVVEGKVERVRVAGSRYFSLGRIVAGAPADAPGQAPQLGGASALPPRAAVRPAPLHRRGRAPVPTPM